MPGPPNFGLSRQWMHKPQSASTAAVPSCGCGGPGAVGGGAGGRSPAGVASTAADLRPALGRGPGGDSGADAGSFGRGAASVSAINIGRRGGVYASACGWRGGHLFNERARGLGIRRGCSRRRESARAGLVQAVLARCAGARPLY